MLPNLIIIGAAKAGTTSLHRYLDLHPEIAMAAPTGTAEKEMRFFWRDDWRERRDWYESHFETDRPVRGEATPAYTAHAFHAGVPERMHELIPDAKLVYLVRDPIERILSHWVQRRADGDPTSLARYVEDCDAPRNPIVCPSRYWTQVQQYLPFYDPAQILIVDQAELGSGRRGTLRQVFRFLGVDETFESPGFDQQANTRADKRGPRRMTMRLYEPVLAPMARRLPGPARTLLRAPAGKVLYGRVRERPVLTDTMRDRLHAHLAGEAEAFRTFTGREFARWSV